MDRAKLWDELAGPSRPLTKEEQTALRVALEGRVMRTALCRAYDLSRQCLQGLAALDYSRVPEANIRAAGVQGQLQGISNFVETLLTLAEEQDEVS